MTATSNKQRSVVQKKTKPLTKTTLLQIRRLVFLQCGSYLVIDIQYSQNSSNVFSTSVFFLENTLHASDN